MIGVVLAAGSGQRLMPHTRDLPKTLLSVTDDRTILDVVLHNLATCSLTDVAIVVGHRAEALERRVGVLESRHGVRLRLIRNDRVFIAVPPLYRIDIGKETHWAADDQDRDRILKEKQKGNAKPEITRFKGLGEMMPAVLWETTLNPRTRRMLRVSIADALETDRVMNELMGKDPSARFHFIMDRAEEAEELDV